MNVCERCRDTHGRKNVPRLCICVWRRGLGLQRRRLLNGGYEWVPPPAESRQSDGGRGAPSAADRVVLQLEGTSLQKDGAGTDGGFCPCAPPEFFPRLPPIGYFSPPSEMSDATSDIMSLVLSTLLLKCQILGHHIGESASINPPKCIISGIWVLSVVVFPAFLQRQTLHSFITRSLVL